MIELSFQIIWSTSLVLFGAVYFFRTFVKPGVETLIDRVQAWRVKKNLPRHRRRKR
jgi:hypothetical protein